MFPAAMGRLGPRVDDASCATLQAGRMKRAKIRKGGQTGRIAKGLGENIANATS